MDNNLKPNCHDKKPSLENEKRETSDCRCNCKESEHDYDCRCKLNESIIEEEE